MADVKPDIKPEAFSIKLKDSNGAETVFKLKKTTKFSKILQAYAAKVGIVATSVRLMFNGDNIDENATPESLEMEDGDCVDVMMQQTGGAF